MSAAACTLFLLGQPRLLRPGAAPHLLERRDAALLAALVLEGPMPRERAMAWLWPQADRKAGQNNLRQRLFRLKQLGGRDLVSSAAVLALADGVVHNIDGFAQRLANGAAKEDELLATLDYSGTGDLGDWVDQARERWRQRRRVLLAQAADEQEAAGQATQALALAERLVRDDPGAERAHRQRMRLHYLRGDMAAAAVAWRQCQRQLREWVDAEPGPETRALASLIAQGLPPSPPGAGAGLGTPAALQRPPRLIGREGAWHALQAAWQQGRHLVLAGEPGMGKSRLLADFAQAHTGAMLMGARPGDAGLPYTTLQRLLRALCAPVADLVPWVKQEFARLLPELGEAAAGRLQPLRLQRAVAQALADAHAQQGLRVLMLDDFQFADTATQALLLACLSQPAPGLPLPWLAVRAGEVPQRLADWLAEQPAGAAAELRLPALTPPQVNEFVASLGLPQTSAATWAPVLVRRTGGNPLFMLQVLLASGADIHVAQGVVPDNLARVMAHRLQTLTPAALRVARVSALAGPQADVALVARVLGVHAVDLSDAYAELQGTGLLSDGAAFAYDLLQDTMRRAVPAPVACLLHAQIADALAQRATPPAVVAHHLAEAGQWAEAAACLETAARQAHAAASQQTELDLHDQAADAHRRAGAPGAEWQARLCALACAHTQEPAHALHTRVEQLLATAADATQRLAVLLHGARVRLSASDGEGALVFSQPALQMAEAADNNGARLQATAWHGLALALVGQRDEGLQLLQSALGLASAGAPSQPDARARLDFYGSLGYVLHMAGRYREAMGPIREAADIAADLGELGDCVEQTNNLAVCCSSAGDRGAEVQATDRAIAVWRQMGEPAGLAADTMLVQACTTFMGNGRYRQALELLPGAAARLAQGPSPHWAVIATHRLAGLYIRLGQPARAQQALPPLPADATAGAQAARAVCVARLAWLAGHEACLGLRQAHAQWGAALEPLDRHTLLLVWAELTPDDAFSIALCESLIAECRADSESPTLRHALLRRAWRSTALGQTEAALRDLRQAWAGPSDRPVQGLETAEVCRLAASLALRLGDTALARDALQEGVAWLARVQPHVPAAFLDSWLHRNPAVRGLRLMAQAEFAAPAAA